ncbi:hypothetical protein LTR66_010299 [Elasticomyces elasticus]|nr:hypothetical protein LTR66_010299 [Elasticomyces elasticus]
MAYFASCLAIIAFAWYFHIESVSEKAHRSTIRPIFSHIPSWFLALLLGFFILRTSLYFSRANHVSFHPVDMLMYEARTRHATYVSQSASSQNLTAAVDEYRTRYQRNPPPGFRQWYDYAVNRSSLVIDDFDSIHNDLLPFWALDPVEIRRRTWEVISNPWNDIAGISIRNGKAEISPNVMPTHRWMLDGLVYLIDHFAPHLPDMDLAFNLNDECRVAVPFEDIEPMRTLGSRMGSTAQHPPLTFSSNRAAGWDPIPEEPIHDTPFIERSFQRTFTSFGSIGCPPTSPARTQNHWETSTLCTTCSSPHSLGAFLSNWTLSANICHQPDLASLHGFYLSPAAFKATHTLYPVFSQSKVFGYNDILYPSAWNYMDKVKYDPTDDYPDMSFSEKKDTLFWRGATSEGVSPGSGTWKGMTRQRFLHLANNINNTTPAQPILIPSPLPITQKTPNRKASYKYRLLSPADLASRIAAKTDVHIVDFIARCGGADCSDQAAEFAPLATPSDFQDHWSYKYLLDLDGAGFSGRFLPFLQSHSLPIKAALFREWYDSCLTPWLHFVPLDSRGHGFWATLGYFVGLKGNDLAKAHETEAEAIAEKGREWAGKVLRKEDMEVYFFRLLLEWGRLTDDKRNELGFTMET